MLWIRSGIICSESGSCLHVVLDPAPDPTFHVIPHLYPAPDTTFHIIPHPYPALDPTFHIIPHSNPALDPTFHVIPHPYPDPVKLDQATIKPELDQEVER